MVRKMAYVGISYLAGLFFASFFVSVINAAVAAVLLLLSFVSVFLLKANQNLRNKVIVVLISFSAALTSYSVYTELVYKNVVGYSNKEITFEGRPTQIRYINNDMMIINAYGKINNKEKAEILVMTTATEIDYNDSVYIEGKAEKLSDSLSFSSEAYYKSKNIFVSVNEPSVFSVRRNDSFSVMNSVDAYRKYIQKRIMSFLPSQEGAFLCGMLTGDSSMIDDDVLSDFYKCGTGHILSVSGTHLMIIASIVLYLLKLIRARNSIVFAVTELFIILFCFFASFSLSVIRAAVMFTVLMLGLVLKRNGDVLNSLGTAGILITLFNPYAIRDASFLLSFGGTFAIGVFAPWVVSFFDFKGKFAPLLKALTTMICVSLCTFPFVVMYFDEVSLISPAANLILIPLCAFSLVCGALVLFTGGISLFAVPLLFASGVFLRVVLLIVKAVSGIPFITVATGYGFLIYALVLCLVTIVIISLVFRKRKAVIASVLSSVIVLCLCSGIYVSYMKDKLEICVFTDGSSCAVSVSENGSNVIIDLEGNGSALDSMSRYLARTGKSNTDILCINNNCQSNLSRYINCSRLDITEAAIYGVPVCTENSIRVIPLTDRFSVSSDDIDIKSENGRTYIVNYGLFSLICTSNNDIIKDSACSSTLILRYNSKPYILEINGEVYNISNADNSSCGISITAEKDGKNIVRRIDYAMRE